MDHLYVIMMEKQLWLELFLVEWVVRPQIVLELIVQIFLRMIGSKKRLMGKNFISDLTSYLKRNFFLERMLSDYIKSGRGDISRHEN